MLQLLQMKDPLNLPKLTPKSEIFGGPEKGDFFILPHFAAKNTEFCRILRQPFPHKSSTFAPNFKAR